MWPPPAEPSAPIANELFPTTAWRLLLPDPAPDAVVAFGEGPTASMAREAFAHASDGPRPDVALAVGDGFADASLSQLAATLAPGGVAYVEGRGALARGSGSIRRRFEECGFAHVQFYALSPAPDRWKASWWIPVDAPAVARFVTAGRLAQRVPHGSLRGRLAAVAHRVARSVPTVIAARPWLLHPNRPRVLCAVAVRSGGSGQMNAIPALVRAVLTPSVPGRSPGVPRALLRAGGSSTDQPMLFVFGPGETEPRAVLKAPSRSEEIVATAHEHTILRALADAGVPGVPRPIDIADVGELGVLGQTYVPGERLADVVRPNDFSALAESVTDWAIELAKRTIGSAGPGPRALATSLISALRPVIGTTDAAPLGVLLSTALVDMDVDVVHHRDLGPWNVHLASAGEIGVIDWADAAMSGPPMCDLVHHLTHLALCADDAYEPVRLVATIAANHDPNHVFGRTIARCLDRYARAVGLPPTAIAPLRMLTWLVDLDRQEPEAREASIYLTLLRHEIAAWQASNADL